MSSHDSTPTYFPSEPLSSEIHTATRSYHTSLNKLVTARLPLCLPPNAQDATTYAAGIAAFAEIFFAFEEEWTSIVSPLDSTRCDVSTSIRDALSVCYLPSLLRTRRLQNDLSLLLSRDHQSHSSGNDQSSPSTIASDIRARINARPQTLLAYTWIMYMALFNGGRWIRSQLVSTTTSPSRSTSPSKFWPQPGAAQGCLTFWHFDGDEDGEDIKRDFRAKFEKAAGRLTYQQREDVVGEAIRVFGFCERIILRQLDVAFAAQPESISGKNTRPARPPAQTPKPSNLQSLLSTVVQQVSPNLTWVWALILACVLAFALDRESNDDDKISAHARLETATTMKIEQLPDE